MTIHPMGQEQYRIHAEQQRTHWWFVARRMVLAATAEELLEERDRAKVVDLGCGSGANAAAFASYRNYVGIDPEEDSLRFARQCFPGVEFLRGTVGVPHVNTRIGAADLVLLTDVLEHVEDDRGLLAQVINSVAPGCHVLITVPADMRLWSRHDVNLGHYRRYDCESLERLWSGLPVSDLLVSYFNSRLFWPIMFVRSVNRWRGTTSGDAGTDLSKPPRLVNRLLKHIFCGECKRLVNVLRGTRREGYRRGVSLIAVLRREEGDFEPCSKPTVIASKDCSPQTRACVSSVDNDQ